GPFAARVLNKACHAGYQPRQANAQDHADNVGDMHERFVRGNKAGCVVHVAGLPVCDVSKAAPLQSAGTGLDILGQYGAPQLTTSLIIHAAAFTIAAVAVSSGRWWSSHLKPCRQMHIYMDVIERTTQCARFSFFE